MLKNLLHRLRPRSESAAPPPVDAPSADDVPAADALIVQGNALEDAGDAARAEQRYREAVAKAPRHARGHLNLGIVLGEMGDTEGAAKAYESVLALDPLHPFGNYNFARLLFMRNELERSAKLVREALRAKPDFPQALVLHASVLEATGQLAEAVDALEAAVRMQPDNAGAWFNLSRLLRELGFPAQVIEPVRTAIRKDPTNLAYRSQELMLLNFEDGMSGSDIYDRHVEFGVWLQENVPARFKRFLGSRDPDRRVRVGYVSGDFHAHPVTLFLLPVLEHHDRAAVEIFCYSTGTESDDFTQRVRNRSDHWLDARALSDSQLADAIHADAIDILMDLTGHTSVPRLGVFSQRPAPVQATWLGYLNTTGLTRMDYRLSDVRCDPVESSQALHTEQLIFLPCSQWCYRPLSESMPSAQAPVERNGYVTFGSFNASLKITPATCRRWARLLSRLPGSRLMIAGVRTEQKRAAIAHEMASFGIESGRVDFMPRVSLDKYSDLISSVDISLDTFPYGGGTTTFDALWMGVPVLTAVGDIPMSRSAASILVALGLEDWVVPCVDDFVDMAVERASDHQVIASLRHSLRQRMKDSPLTDEVRYVKDLEAAYRDMWIARCK